MSDTPRTTAEQRAELRRLIESALIAARDELYNAGFDRAFCEEDDPAKGRALVTQNTVNEQIKAALIALPSLLADAERCAELEAEVTCVARERDCNCDALCDIALAFGAAVVDEWTAAPDDDHSAVLRAAQGVIARADKAEAKIATLQADYLSLDKADDAAHEALNAARVSDGDHPLGPTLSVAERIRLLADRAEKAEAELARLQAALDRVERDNVLLTPEHADLAVELARYHEATCAQRVAELEAAAGPSEAERTWAAHFPRLDAAVRAMLAARSLRGAGEGGGA